MPLSMLMMVIWLMVHLQQSIMSPLAANELLGHYLVIIPRLCCCCCRWLRVIAGLILVCGHVSGQVVSLAETLIANGTLQLVFALPPMVFVYVFTLVVGPHVIHQIAGHAETNVALGANVLGGQRERGCDCGWN